MAKVKSIKNKNLKDDLWNQIVQFQNLALLPASCVILGKSLNHSDPQFLRLKNGDDHSAYLCNKEFGWEVASKLLD